MKKTISILLAFSFFSANIGSLFIVVHYELNKKQITQEYCVNKDKPMMHCDGQCHLRQMLKKENKKEHKSPMNIAQFSQLQLMFQDIEPINVKNYAEVLEVVFPKYKIFHTQELIDPVFHPPTFA